MAATQQVIIEFIGDFSDIKSGTQELVKMGKVDAALGEQFKKTNTEIKKQGDAFEKAARAGNNETTSLGKLQQLMAQFPKTGINRFLLQLGNELTSAGVKVDGFFNKTKKTEKELEILKAELAENKEAVAKLRAELEKLNDNSDKGEKKVKTLKQELKLLKDQMQQVAITSGVTSDAYKKLAARAGELDDTIKDVNDDIANAGSDTRGIDNVVGSISALAGGYSAVQGAAALFGDESEDLQKALLKVNAAMAIATGIQQVANAVTKQGSLTRLADTTATYAQIAAQKIYTAVTGRATAATVAFKVALAATGIGLVILAIVALNNAFSDAEESTEDLTKALEDLEKANAGAVRGINRAKEEAIALAEEQGKTAVEVSQISIDAIKKEIDANRNLENQLRSQIGQRQKRGKIDKELADKVNETFEQGINLQSQLRIAEANQRKLAADDRKKEADEALEKGKENAAKSLEAARRQRAADFADFKAGIERQLLATEEGSREELALKQRLANAQLQIDLEAENLTQNQRKLLIQKFFKDRKEMERQFNRELIAEATEAEKNRLQATLANLSLGEEERLQVRIDFLRISAAAEIQAAEGNAAKIRLINAELNAAIAAAKIESIQRTAQEENRLLSAANGSGRRALEAVAGSEKARFEVRINAIRQLQAFEAAAIQREIDANREANKVKGADNRALQIEYEELLDRKAQATEAAEKRITDILDSETKKRKDLDTAYIQFAVQGLQELGAIAASIQQNQQQAAQNSIELQKREVDDLLKAGAISEREAERRNKKIEAEERAAKNRAARQIKALAVFQALLAIPQAYLAGLQTPVIGAIVGPAYAALAAVQAGLVAARPVPKFATGKKGTWSGVGIVGDAGAELVEREDGRMEVALKATPTYIGPKDIVYTAAETRAKMPFVNKEAISATGKAESFDYGKMAAAIKQKPSSTVVNIDKEFISESVANGLMKSRYFDRYYRSK